VVCVRNARMSSSEYKGGKGMLVRIPQGGLTFLSKALFDLNEFVLEGRITDPTIKAETLFSVATRVEEEAKTCGEDEDGMLSLTTKEVSCVREALGRYYDLIASGSIDYSPFEKIALEILGTLRDIFMKHESLELN